MKDKEKCFMCNKDITKQLPKIDVNGNYYCNDCYLAKCKKELEEKQIEEMAQLIEDRLIEANNVLGSMNRGYGFWIAQKLVEHYQPKLPEDSVVLSMEEYERLKDQANIKCDVENIREAVFDTTSCVIGYKEAEKIYQRCFPDNPEQFVKERKPSYNDGYFDGSKETAEEIFAELFYVASTHHSDIANILAWAKEKAKQHGVEIKE